MGKWKGGQLEEIKSKLTETTGSYQSNNNEDKGKIHKEDTECIEELGKEFCKMNLS